MAEIGLIASVIQVAGAGLKLSQTLYQYAEGVATADRRIKDIAKEVELTSFVVNELGAVFKNNETSSLMSKNAVKTANETMKECSTVFAEIEKTLTKSKKNTFGKLLLPFRDSKIELLRTHVDKLKSTLQLLLQVLMHAHQIAAKKLDREAEAQQKAQIQELIEREKKSAKKYTESLKNFSNSDESTGDELEDVKDDGSLPARDLMAMAIGFSINPKTLETCVHHVRSLLDDIEKLQQALTQEIDDHSDHQQSLVSSYFRAREHLEGVLFSGTQHVNSVAGSARTAESHKQHNSSIGAQIGIRKTMTGSTLHSTSSLERTLTEAEYAKALQEATEKARQEEKDKVQLEAEVFRAEKEAEHFEVKKKLLEYERLLKDQSANNPKALSTLSIRQFPITFRDTLGTTYTFPYNTCNTWDGIQVRVKNAYARIHEWSRHASAGRYDIVDVEGYVILPEDFDQVVQPGMGLSMRFWPDCEPLTCQFDYGQQEDLRKEKERQKPIGVSNSSSKRPGSRRGSMNRTEQEEHRRLLAADLERMQNESRATEAREREERAANLRQQQQDTAYYHPRTGSTTTGPPANSSGIIRRNSQSRRSSLSHEARPVLERSNSQARRTSMVQPDPWQLYTQVPSVSGYSTRTTPSTRQHQPPPLSFHNNARSSNRKRTAAPDERGLESLTLPHTMSEKQQPPLISNDTYAPWSQDTSSEEAAPTSSDAAPRAYYNNMQDMSFQDPTVKLLRPDNPRDCRPGLLSPCLGGAMPSGSQGVEAKYGTETKLEEVQGRRDNTRRPPPKLIQCGSEPSDSESEAGVEGEGNEVEALLREWTTLF